MTANGIQGVAKFRDRLTELQARIHQAAKATAYTAGNIAMTEAKEYAPKDLGVLRASGYVTLPNEDGAVELGFGGPAADYAVVQHENPDFRHAEGGWKFLERALIDVRLADIGDLFRLFMSQKNPKAPGKPVATDPWEEAGGAGGPAVRNVVGKAGALKTVKRAAKSARSSAMAFVRAFSKGGK